MAAGQKVKLEFKPLMNTKQCEIKNIKIVYGADGSKRKEKAIESIPMIFIVEKGDTFEVTKDEFKELVAKGSVMSKKQAEARRTLLDSGKAVADMTDEERRLAFDDKPEEV